MLFKTEGETTCFQADYGVESPLILKLIWMIL